LLFIYNGIIYLSNYYLTFAVHLYRITKTKSSGRFGPLHTASLHSRRKNWRPRRKNRGWRRNFRRWRRNNRSWRCKSNF